MKNNDKLYIAKISANKTYRDGISRDYSFIINVYAEDIVDAEGKINVYVESRSIPFEVEHKLIKLELSEPLAQRSQSHK